jgi:RNA polymerase sigma-70 factor (ECF subfamily)
MADDDLRALVERARRGQPEAFEALYERFEAHVYALCARLLADPEAAAEATGAIWLTVWQRLRGLRHAEAFTAWLRQTAVRECHRRQRRRPWWRVWGGDEAIAERADEQPPPAAGLTRDELAERVQAALARLSAEHREVVVLHHLEGLPVAEIAGLLDVAPGTVKSRLGRARTHLTRLLGPYLEDD